MQVQRYDTGRLGRAKRTGAGGARVPASISRTGVQVYTDQHGRTVREYRPPEEVFAEASLETLASIPVTVGHPPSGVTPQNHRELSVGHVTDVAPERRKDGAIDWVDTALVVSDGRTLGRIELPDGHPDALREVSMGYVAEVDPTPGVAPDGTHYDAVQKNIRFNHLALLPDGHARAGRGARLRLDGNQEPTMFVRSDDNTTPAVAPRPRVTIDGIDCERGSDTHISLLERARDGEKKRADEAASALTAAQTELGTLKAKLDEAEKAAKVDVNQLVTDELAFRQGLVQILPKGADGKAYDFSGKTRDQVRADAVGAAVVAEAAKLSSDAERSGFIAAHLKMKLDAAAKAPPALHVPRPVTDAGDAGGSEQKTKRVDKRADAYTASWGAAPSK